MKKSLLAVFMAFTVALGAMGATACNKKADDNSSNVVPSQPSDPENDPENPTVVEVTSVALSESSKSLKVGESFTLTATVSPADATDKTISWSSSDEQVATVSSSGVVTAVAAGEAQITATSADGASDSLTITVEASAQPVVSVESVSLDVTAKELTAGGSFNITATVYPTNATNKAVSWSSSNEQVATVSSSGVVTAVAAGSASITITTADGAKTAVCTVTVKAQSAAEFALTYSYAGNECAAFEWADSSPANATVQYKLSTETNYTTLDEELIRSSSSTVARADVLGLKGGENYDFKITSSAGKTVTTTLAITAYDRSGYAHFNYTSGVGAYNDDGTLKENATVIYLTEANKNNVDGNGNSIAKYLTANARNKTPIAIRVIGTVGSATWNEIDYNANNTYSSSNHILAADVKGANDKQLPTRSATQAELLSGGYNTLNYYPTAYNGAKCEAIDGLNSKIKYTAADDDDPAEYDSCWNDCTVKKMTDVTVEGIGEDAKIFQWGFTWKECNSIEIRNLTFEDYTEDACSFEGGSSEDSSSTPSDFSSKHYWIHHNTFEEGVNYWDVCSEQDKHDGDGSTDFKYCAFITLSYNNYNYTHKTGLIGGGNSQHTASVTFHHNYYNGCKARLPLARQANMHMYNNYYGGTTSCDISLRANAYALIENCYFESSNNKPVELQYDKTGYGAAKLINCVITQSKISTATNVPSGALYVGSDREATVTNENKYGTTFDTDSSLFYYDTTNKKSDVTTMYTAEETKAYVPKLAGVQKRNGTV